MATITRDRFMKHVSKDPVTGCWMWTGNWTRRMVGDYGLAWSDGKLHRAHRISYQLFVGRIPDGLVIDHLCRVCRCVNPRHLEAVTQSVNIDRGILGAIIRSRKAQTHCKRGHEFTPENTKRKPGGRRECRACSRRLQNERRAMYGRSDWPRKRDV
jgi:hypothetical protein